MSGGGSAPEKDLPSEIAAGILFYIFIWFCAVLLSWGLYTEVVSGQFALDPFGHIMTLEGAVGFSAIAGMLTYLMVRNWRRRGRSRQTSR